MITSERAVQRRSRIVDKANRAARESSLSDDCLVHQLFVGSQYGVGTALLDDEAPWDDVPETADAIRKASSRPYVRNGT
jgi:hypothetical protein